MFRSPSLKEAGSGRQNWHGSFQKTVKKAPERAE
jgi:hypothetical protein